MNDIYGNGFKPFPHGQAGTSFFRWKRWL